MTSHPLSLKVEDLSIHSVATARTMEADERLCAGFREYEELVMPLPVDSSDEEDEPGPSEPAAREPNEPESTRGRMQRILEQIAEGCSATAPALLDLSFWRKLASEEGLHVCVDRPQPLDEGCAAGEPEPVEAAALRRSLELRGYFVSSAAARPTAASDGRLARMTQRLRRHGFAPAFIYIFDEAWELLEHSWALAAAVLAPGEPAAALVLEPSFHAHALVSSAEQAAAQAAADAGSAELPRYSAVGGQFGLPHRDHSTRECFDSEGRATMLSLWCPLTKVAADNGCMHVRTADPNQARSIHSSHFPPYLVTSNQPPINLLSRVANCT